MDEEQEGEVSTKTEECDRSGGEEGRRWEINREDEAKRGGTT